MLTEAQKEEMTGVGKLRLPSGELVIFDLEDQYLVDQFNWHKKIGDSGMLYVQSSQPDIPRTDYLARLVMNTPKGMHCDHRHGDGLDNRKSKLRNVTPSQNQRGFRRKPENCGSAYRGVWFDKRTGRWTPNACFRENGKLKKIGCGSFPTEKEAAIAYNWLAASLGFSPESFNKLST